MLDTRLALTPILKFITRSSKPRAPKAKPAKRQQRPFPASSFEEALDFAKVIHSMGSGQSVRRLTLFDHMGKAPESVASRQLVTNASKYGLVEGGYSSEHLSLTEKGVKAVSEDIPERESKEARAQLAIFDIDIFNKLYEKFTKNKLPAKSVLVDSIKELGIPDEYADEGIDTFIINLRFTGLLETLSGAERIISLEHLLDSLLSVPIKQNIQITEVGKVTESIITVEQAGFENTCFYIAPIGADESEFRKHSDLFLGSIVEPALERFNLKVIRADSIDKPGFITKQVIEHLMRARLVVADLSFHNPNVFYELAIRHAVRLPVVQIIRKADSIPFDIQRFTEGVR